MNKTLHLYIFIFIISLIACSKKTEPVRGCVIDNVYYNTSINWTMPLDSNWRLHNLFDVDENTNMKYGYDEALFQLIQYNKNELVAFSSQLDGTNTVNGKAQYKELLSSTATEIEQNLYKTYPKLLKFGKPSLSKEESKLIIDNVEFDCLTITFSFKDISTKILLAVTEINNLYLSINITSKFDKDFDYMLGQFKKSCFSESCIKQKCSIKNKTVNLDELSFEDHANKYLQLITDKEIKKALEYSTPVFEQHKGYYKRIEKEQLIKLSEYMFPDSMQVEFKLEPAPKEQSLVYKNLCLQILPYKTSATMIDSLIVSPSELIGIYLIDDNKYFFAENTPTAINSLALFIPRHILRKITHTTQNFD